ncbi:MAG: alpha-1,2-fucosyltransferase [Nitrospinae bacterium]|nr:alpha-1,2-fucosyltransferase [Nitrospinota bacterium]
MIISHLLGGLGNQMFQYSAGRALSLSHREQLKLDVSAYSGYRLHQGFELHRVFDCPAGIATGSDMRKVLGWRPANRLRKILSRAGLAKSGRDGRVVEPHPQYWPGLKDAPDNCYIVGYWLSEKYFADVADVIRGDFTFKPPMSGQNAGLADKIVGSTSVSLHIRRGDYATNPETNAAHGLCSLDYYRSAVRYVSEKIERPVFLVFSDDIEWSRRSLAIEFPCQFIDHNNGAESFNDMRLMSLCKHNIIANSTFSWWGAWLNPNPEKIVVAPRAWLADKSLVPDYDQFMKDLIPSTWTLL